MSSLAWLIVFFFILCFLVLLVYILVVRAFYWGDKSREEGEKRRKGEKGKSAKD